MDDSGNGFIPGVQGCFSCEKTQKTPFRRFFVPQVLYPAELNKNPLGGMGKRM